MLRSVKVRVSLVLAGLAGVAGLVAGCNSAFINNLIEPLGDDIEVVFINDTAFRASFTFATYDPLDRTAPGGVDFEQRRLEGGGTTDTIVLSCARAFAIGTDELVQRMNNLDAQTSEDFDADAFDSVVHFSNADADSELAALPISGTAAGVEKLVGVDFSCGDRLIFTIRRDPDADGGFRIDYQLIQN
jgi:hypothetical protein